MKINLLKYGKKALTVVLAIAVLAVSLFSAVGSILVSAATWDGATADTTWEGEGTEASPYILSTAEEVYGMVTSGGNGSYYKIADDVDALYFNNVEGMTKDQATAFFTGETAKNSWNASQNTWSGTFDGNGATLYGLYSVSEGYNAFINVVDHGSVATVKNVNFDLCYFENTKASANPWSYASGVVFGKIGATSAAPEGTTKATANVDTVKVTNSTITSHNGAAVFFGFACSASINANRIITVNNTATSDNESTNAAKAASLLVGGAGWSCTGSISNAILTEEAVVLPTNSYTTNYFNSNVATYIVGEVHASDTLFTKLTQDQMKGAAAQTNMPGLTWGAGGFEVGAEGEYPTFAAGEAVDDGSWDGRASTELTLLDPTQPNSEKNPYLIQSAGDMLYLNRLSAGSASDANNATAGKYYKVADGIESIEFNPVSDLTTVAEVKAYFEDEDNVRNVYSSANASAPIHYFAGTFDGNGCTFYGLYNVEQSAGLFAGAGAGAVIKNVKLANSYINSPQRAGGIVGQLVSASSVTVQACTVVDTFIHISGTATNVGVGGIIGYGHAGAYIIESCLVADCEITRDANASASMHAGAFVSDGWGTTRIIKDSIALGITPGSTKGATGSYENVYTDVACDFAGVTVLTAGAAVKGAAAQESMPNLSWGKNWNTTEDDYPVNKVYVYAIDYDCFIGEQDTAFATWDGTQTNAGTESNPYKITNAAELFGMVTIGGNGKYYKVADGIDVLYANPVKDVEDTKAYFENEESMKFAWTPAAANFNGTFDGNGVTIKGLYNVVDNSTSVGFIPQMNGGTATIKNVAFDGCYFQSAGSADWRTGAAVVIGGSTLTASTANIENVAIKNSYVANIGTGTLEEPNGNAALYVASMSNGYTLNVSNVITYGNTVIAGCNGTPAVIHGDAYSTQASAITINISNAVIADEINFVPNSMKCGTGTQTLGAYTMANTYTNVYAVVVPEVKDRTFDGVTALTADEMKGTEGARNMAALGGAWLFTADSYPELAIFHSLEFAADGDNGHGMVCTDEGCNVIATIAPHEYDENYYCEVCEYQHEHNMVDAATGAPVDCTTDGEVATKCDKDCGYTSTRVVEATGHVFGEVQEATDGDCCHSGTVAYKVCEVCEGKFAPDADKMSTDVLETIETGVMGEHNWVAQDALHSACEEVEDIAYDKCDICNKYRVGEDIQDEAPTIAGHTFGEVHEATAGDCCTLSTVAYKECEACELKFAADAEETATEALETIYGEYGAHNWIPQTPIAAGCAGGQPIAYDKCDICNKYQVGGTVQDEIPVAEGHVFSEVHEATAGDCCTLGTVAYKSCLACGENFAPDADKNATETLETIYTGYGEHNWVAQDALHSECEEVEDIAYDKCDICNKYRVGEDISEIKPEIEGHNCTWKYVESVCAAVYGIDYSECEACGKLFDVEGNEIEEVPEAPGHTYSFINYDETHHWYECACGEYEEKYEHEGDPCGCGYVPAPTGVWMQDGNGWWYKNADGSYPASAWLALDGTWYYFNASGYMVTGWQSIGGTWYYFYDSGAMATEWVLDGAWYYMDASGAMVTGWKQVGDTWYYFNASGAMATGWVFDGAWYYMDASGAMVTEWLLDGTTWYYFDASGAMVTGWQVIGGDWYYFYGSGAMAANCYVDNCWVDANGVWVA